MNKKMRVFPKEMEDYERVYTDKRYLSKFNINRLQKPPGFDSIKEYEDTLRVFFKTKSVELWNSIVQTEWLFSNFKYLKKNGEVMAHTNVTSRVAFDVFTSSFIGTGYSFLISSFYYGKIKGYFKDFYPDFYKRNPFKDPKSYAFPFKNIPIDYLIVVYNMPERLDLLKIADEKDMQRGEFLDFIINYIGKYNETEPKEVFSFFRSMRHPTYVKLLKKIK